MAFTSHTPSSPWTTGISGSGTWAQMVTFINNPAILSQIGDTYVVTGLIEIRAIMTALLSSVVISRGGGGWSIAVGGSVTFGRTVTTPSGVVLPVDGCLWLEDIDAYARGVDNYLNTKCVLRNSGYLNLYNTQYVNKNAARSDFDFASGSFLKMRTVTVTIDSGVDQFDHYAGSVDIDGLYSTHASDTGGSILELMTTSVITKLNNMTPFLNNATSRQCTLWIRKVTLSKWGGDNFAPWDLSGYYRFEDPKVMALTYVDRGGTGGSSQCETRTTEFLCLDTSGAVSATISVINNVDELDAEGVASATTGIFTAKLKRKVFPGGTSGPPTGYTRTPHVVWAKKWGYKTYNSALLANPTSYDQSKLTAIVAMVPDTNINRTSAVSSAISGVTIEYHGRAVTWNNKDFSITITANSGLSLSDIYHSVAYQISEANVLQARASAITTGLGHNYNTPWLGASGDSSVTLVLVQTTRPGDVVFASQISGSVGTATVGFCCRTHVNRGLVFQNYTNDLFPDGSYTASQLQFQNPDGGEQLLISVGTYNATTKTVSVWTNNKFFASSVQVVDRTAAAQFFRVFGQGDGANWATEQHRICEQMAFNRALSDAEISTLSKYLAKKWHHMGVGNIVPNSGNQITSANYPVNTSGTDWTPSDYASGQGPLNWISMASPSDYTLSGNNITSFKDKATGNQITNSGYASATVTTNYRKLLAHQLLNDLVSTNYGVYADGRNRGVRVITETGTSFPGFEKMCSDDGTYHYPPITLTISSNVSLVGARIRIYDLDSGLHLSYGTTLVNNESCPNSTFSFTGVAGNLIMIQILLADYIEFTQQTIVPSVSGGFYAVLANDNSD